MNKTSIEWTHRPGTIGMTWNPIRARLKGQGEKVRGGTFCTRISPGCTNCYASAINKRFGNGLEYTVPNLEQVEFFISEKILQEPLHKKTPCTIFVGDMFDLFHEAIPDELIDRVMAVALHCAEPWHRCFQKDCDHSFCDDAHLREVPPQTLQFLTKRADRLFRYMSAKGRHQKVCDAWQSLGWYFEVPPIESSVWPPKTSWFGVSVESPKYRERIYRLQDTPAALRFLSIEPQLEDILLVEDSPEVGEINILRGFDGCDPAIPGIDWVICGGESGPGARPFNLAWAESLLEQCRTAGVPFFMKQIGSNPVATGNLHGFACTAFPNKRSKGGDMSEWPEHLRVREFPKVREAVTA